MASCCKFPQVFVTFAISHKFQKVTTSSCNQVFVTFWLEVNYQLFAYFYLTVCLLLNGSNFVPLWTQFEYRVYNFFYRVHNFYTEFTNLYTECSNLHTECTNLYTECTYLYTECTNLYTECINFMWCHKVQTYIHITKQLLDPHFKKNLCGVIKFKHTYI